MQYSAFIRHASSTIHKFRGKRNCANYGLCKVSDDAGWSENSSMAFRTAAKYDHMWESRACKHKKCERSWYRSFHKNVLAQKLYSWTSVPANKGIVSTLCKHYGEGTERQCGSDGYSELHCQLEKGFPEGMRQSRRRQSMSDSTGQFVPQGTHLTNEKRRVNRETPVSSSHSRDDSWWLKAACNYLIQFSSFAEQAETRIGGIFISIRRLGIVRAV